jgi:uncharacterized protein
MYTIIAKVTHECNLQCKYCYVSDDAETGRMDDETLQALLHKAAKLNTEGKTSFIWHGGEPLLMGIDFYKKIVEIQKTIPNHVFHNSIQSNGTLLNKTYLDFFEEYKFRIGLSIDGIKITHDKNRLCKSGKSSFEDALAWIDELKKRKIGGGAICVLNKNTAPHIAEIYKFSKEKQINFKFNPQLPAGQALKNDDLGLTPEELAKTYIELFDMWFFDNAEYIPRIEPFEGIIKGIGESKNKKHREIIPFGCCFRNNCAYSFLAVVPNGNIYPCGRFVGDTNLLYGNVNVGELQETLQNPIRQKFIERNKGLTECTKCEYNKICNSGCPDHSYLFYGDIMHKDPYCYTYKKLFKHIENILINELKNFEDE